MCDYSKGLIYKWVCNDCDEIYVGSTINFTRRKQSHKTSCTNEKDKKHHLKIYKTMREYGGFENWRMIQVETYPCQSKRELEAREEDVRKEINAKLNSRQAFMTQEEKKKKEKQYNKEYRDTHFIGEKKEEHLEKRRMFHHKHKEEINAKRSEKIICDCGQCISRSCLSQHLKTKKHLNYIAANKI